MNLNQVTIQDCLDMFNMLNKAVILKNGQVVGFVKENRLCEKN